MDACNLNKYIFSEIGRLCQCLKQNGSTPNPEFNRFLGLGELIDSLSTIRTNLQLRTFQHIYQWGRAEALGMFDKSAVLQLNHGLLQFAGVVHDDRAVPRHWLLNWFPRNQQEPDAFVAGLNGNLIAAVEQNK
jgi:hypothetical protein